MCDSGNSDRLRPERAEQALLMWAGLWEFSVELAVAGIMSREGCSRDDAMKRVAQRIREDVERDTPAMLRVAKVLYGSQ